MGRDNLIISHIVISIRSKGINSLSSSMIIPQIATMRLAMTKAFKKLISKCKKLQLTKKLKCNVDNSELLRKFDSKGKYTLIFNRRGVFQKVSGRLKSLSH